MLAADHFTPSSIFTSHVCDARWSWNRSCTPCQKPQDANAQMRKNNNEHSLKVFCVMDFFSLFALFLCVCWPNQSRAIKLGTLRWREKQKRKNRMCPERKIERDHMYSIAMPKASTMLSAACLYAWYSCCCCCCWLNIQRNANHKIECQTECEIYQNTHTHTHKIRDKKTDKPNRQTQITSETYGTV